MGRLSPTDRLAVLELSYDDGAASWQQAAPLLHDVEELDVYLARLAGSAGIEALLAIGDLRRAERLLAQIDRRAADGDTALRPLVSAAGDFSSPRRANGERAIASLEAAAVAPEPPQGVNPFELARTLLALGPSSAGRNTSAPPASRWNGPPRSSSGSARASGWRRRDRSCGASAGAPHQTNELSETERRIVELVVAGRRNSEVAATLSLSPNTVAWNLSKVYRKLGVSSRTELAAHVASTPHR